MAQEFQTSFIPKKKFDVGDNAPKNASGLFLGIAGVILLIALVSAGGVLVYERYLESSIESQKQNLQKRRAAFEPETIREISRLDTKMAVAEDVLRRHVSPSGIFEILEESTLESVRFADFSYSISPDGVRIIMNGEASSFASVALQSDAFGEHRYIQAPVFSGFALDERGNVDFNVTFRVDTNAVSYTKRVEEGAVGRLVPETTEEETTSGESSTSTATTTAEEQTNQ